MHVVYIQLPLLSQPQGWTLRCLDNTHGDIHVIIIPTEHEIYITVIMHENVVDRGMIPELPEELDFDSAARAPSSVCSCHNLA